MGNNIHKKRIGWNKGLKMKPRTLEHSKNLSKVLKGRKKSDLHRRKISEAHKGKKFTESHKLNLRKARIGMKYSEESKRKMSNSRIGKYVGNKSANWKGGITPINQKIRDSLEYKLWRRSVKERDNHRCIWCYSNKQIEVDHIKPFALYPELRFAIDNGRTLCKSCHITTDTYGGRKIYKLTANEPNGINPSSPIQ